MIAPQHTSPSSYKGRLESPLQLQTNLVLIQPLPVHLCKFPNHLSKAKCICFNDDSPLFLFTFWLIFVIRVWTENAFVPVPSVIVLIGACLDSGNCDTSGRRRSDLLISHQLSHCHSLEMMICLPLVFLTLLVWQHSLMTQVNIKMCYKIISTSCFCVSDFFY